MGIGPNLTLDATFNPDFGQIEADPSEVNLTANETFFVEKRPFFTEGARLLNMVQATNFFYSRRIGAVPEMRGRGRLRGLSEGDDDHRRGEAHRPPALGDVARFSRRGHRPGNGARLRPGLPAHDASVRVAPRTAYGLMRVQQEFGPWTSTAGLMASAVHRDLEAGDPLAALLARNAFARRRRYGPALPERPVPGPLVRRLHPRQR